MSHPQTIRTPCLEVQPQNRTRRTRECRRPPGIIQPYLGKISGPLLDRIDIHALEMAVRQMGLSARAVTPDVSQAVQKTFANFASYSLESRF